MLTSHGVFTEAEIKSRYEITLENYCKTIIIEANTMVDMAKTEIAPAVQRFAADIAKGASAKKALVSGIACGYETQLVNKLSDLTDSILIKTEELEDTLSHLSEAGDIGDEAHMICNSVLTKMDELRAAADKAETLTAKTYWPYPSYADLLFGVK